MSYAVKTEMSTTTYTEEECDRGYMNGFFENVAVNKGEYDCSVVTYA